MDVNAVPAPLLGEDGAAVAPAGAAPMVAGAVVDVAVIHGRPAPVRSSGAQKHALLCTCLKNKAQFWKDKTRARVITQLLAHVVFQNLNRGHIQRGIAAYIASIHLARHLGGSMLSRTRDMSDSRAFSVRVMLKILCLTYEMLSLGDRVISVPGSAGTAIKIQCRVVPDGMRAFFERLVLYRKSPNIRLEALDYKYVQQFLNVLHEVYLISWASIWLTLAAVENGDRPLAEDSVQLQVASFEAQLQAKREKRMSNLEDPYSRAIFDQSDLLDKELISMPRDLHYFPSLFDVPRDKLCLLPPHQLILATTGDTIPLAKHFLWCFEFYCYRAYTVCLGTHPPSSDFDLGELPAGGRGGHATPSAAEVGRVGILLDAADDEGSALGAGTGEEEEVPVDEEELKRLSSGRSAEETLYLLLGSILRLTAGSILSMGKFLKAEDMDTLKNFFLDTFTVANHQEAKAQGLPVGGIVSRSDSSCTAEIQLFFPSKTLFDTIMDLEMSVIVPAVNNPYLLGDNKLFFAEYLETQIMDSDACLQVGFFFIDNIRAALPSVDQNTCQIVATLLHEKFFQVYTNITINDEVLHKMPALWELGENGTNTISFRNQAALSITAEDKAHKAEMDS